MMMSVVRYFLETVLHILSHQQRSVAYRKQSLERIFICAFMPFSLRCRLVLVFELSELSVKM